MDSAAYPWRPLGELLVDDDVVTALELEHALAEQERSGGLLGRILVERGALTGVELAQVLARQHGVELREADDGRPPEQLRKAAAARSSDSWRSLGMLLVQKGLVNPTSLQQALAQQRTRPNRRLGEILVELGLLSPGRLGSVLAEQHGVDLEAELVGAPPRAAVPGSAYEVAVLDGGGNERLELVYVGPSLLDAADFACDYVNAEAPARVEIRRRHGAEPEAVWTHSRTDAARWGA